MSEPRRNKSEPKKRGLFDFTGWWSRARTSGRLFGRAAASFVGAMLYYAAASNPISGPVVGGITGFLSALRANKKDREANGDRQPGFLNFFKYHGRRFARVVAMTAAGAAAGMVPVAGPFLIGPAVVAVDKISSIGRPPENAKSWKRHVADFLGSAIPGVGPLQYLEQRNHSLTTGQSLQLAPRVTPTQTPEVNRQAPARQQTLQIDRYRPISPLARASAIVAEREKQERLNRAQGDKVAKVASGVSPAGQVGSLSPDNGPRRSSATKRDRAGRGIAG